jgi:hypothetical protein
LTSSNSGSGYNLPLYTGYDSAKVALAVKAIQPPHDIAIRLVRPRVRVDGGTIIISGALMQHATTPMVYAMNGAVRCAAASAGPGSYAVKGLPGGVYAVVIGNGGMPSCSRVLVP